MDAFLPLPLAPGMGACYADVAGWVGRWWVGWWVLRFPQPPSSFSLPRARLWGPHLSPFPGSLEILKLLPRVFFFLFKKLGVMVIAFKGEVRIPASQL